MSFTFRVWRRTKRHRNDGKGERKACVDGESGESGESGRATFVDSFSQLEGALTRAVHSTLDEYDWYSGPVHQYCVTETRRANRI